MRALMPVLLVAGGLVSASFGTHYPSPARRGVRPDAEQIALARFAGRYCIACHSGANKSGGLALDLLCKQAIDRQPEAWERVVRKLRARQMPPPGQTRPDERTYEAVSSSLETVLDRAAAAHPDPGRTE